MTGLVLVPDHWLFRGENHAPPLFESHIHRNKPSVGRFAPESRRPHGSARMLGTLSNQAAPGKEIDEGWKLGFQEFF